MFMGGGEDRGGGNLEAHWVNHLPVTFKWINQIFPRSLKLKASECIRWPLRAAVFN